jgi:hypothetical protein
MFVMIVVDNQEGCLVSSLLLVGLGGGAILGFVDLVRQGVASGLHAAETVSIQTPLSFFLSGCGVVRTGRQRQRCCPWQLPG